MSVSADAHAVFGLDAFVAIPDQIGFQGVDEFVDAVVLMVLVVVELLLQSAEEAGVFMFNVS